MPQENRYEDLCNAFKAEMQQYINEGFRPSDCFPFVFQNLVDSTGLPTTERAELRRQLMDWTKKNHLDQLRCRQTGVPLILFTSLKNSSPSFLRI